MKRFILIMAILLAGSSLKAQEIDTTGLFEIKLTLDGINYIGIDCRVEFLPTQLIKVQQARHLKTKITQLVPIALAMYIWRDELQTFSNKHDKISHGALAFALSHYFGPRFAIGFMLSIELTQIDILKLNGRYKDTAGDLAANGAGIFLAWRF